MNFQQVTLLAMCSILIATLQAQPFSTRDKAQLDHYSRQMSKKNQVATHIFGKPVINHVIPSHSRRVTLYNKLGFYLALYDNGTITGEDYEYCQGYMESCVFNLQSYGTSIVRLQNVRTGRYVAIGPSGTVYTTKARKDKDTLLKERILPSLYTVFWSYTNHGTSRSQSGSINFYLAMKRTREAKNANKTSITHKSGHFLLEFVRQNHHVLPWF
ncbi:uncharacterized protein LOC116601524 [Nematostella vectensis]|uniref:uncharacterized protein LOC116601524 n=1 Tax=Nematostella vectensis TaxID=45351 RepID=UPI00207777D0|nr:uncharacterized protein LOC116601524 [Nematostella vectensis]XP_048577965.1 uncharacterized protein LOC116601524 [Nematostella vectensis]XP_048577968.1 uncharacterized protein LOC116601524 [Nematostella vectensis]XP_048577969.1 uncharacterized protein LOC116601524 [Nematostella vectensis]